MNEKHYVSIIKIKSIMKRIAAAKGEIIRLEEMAFVPEESIQLWKKRGFEPNSIGIAVIKYPHGHDPDKEYVYPLEFEDKSHEKNRND